MASNLETNDRQTTPPQQQIKGTPMLNRQLLAGMLGFLCLAGLPAFANASGYCSQLTVHYGQPQAPASGLMVLPAALVKQQNDPDISGYTPATIMQGSAAERDNPILAAGDRFFALHGGVRSADEALVISGPSLEYKWTAEPNAYLPEGPSYGDQGVYFSHVFTFPNSDLDYAMGSVSPETGQRRWIAAPGQFGQGSAPLVLDSPETGGKMIYGGGAEAIFAINEEGQLQWCSETGLPTGDPVLDINDSIGSHLYGINYQPQGDLLVAIYGTGTLVAFDRATGQRLANYELPGEPAPDSSGIVLSDVMKDGAENAMRKQFVPPGYVLPDGFSMMDTLIAALLGGGSKVNNYFAVDPDSGALWIAATYDDSADGKTDGVSEFGALYRIESQRHGKKVSFSVHCAIPFNGGSASTPAVAPGGERIYTSDSFGKVLAYDAECQRRWALDLGEQVVGSLSISSTDKNIYAATGSSVFRIQDAGNSGTLIWRANLGEAFYDGSVLTDTLNSLGSLESLGVKLPVKLTTANLDLAAITENAILMEGALGMQIDPDNSLMFGPMAMALIALDKQDGSVLNATPAREETVSVISTSQRGEVYLSNSPIRRVVMRGLAEQAALLGDYYLINQLVPPITGGISRYGISNHRQVARDNACFAERRLTTWLMSGMGSGDILLAPESPLIHRMLDAGENQLRTAWYNGEVGPLDYHSALSRIQDASDLFQSLQLLAARDKLATACQMLQ